MKYHATHIVLYVSTSCIHMGQSDQRVHMMALHASAKKARETGRHHVQFSKDVDGISVLLVDNNLLLPSTTQ